jgi:3-oxoadipate enol-lactonase
MTDGLLLLHAFPLDASMWEPQIAAFAGELPVIAPNFPGFGVMPPEGRVMTMGAAVAVAFQELVAEGVDRVVVVGLSMGGYVAFEFWRRHRDRVSGLVLANTKSGADDDAGKERRTALAARLEAEGNGFLAESPPPLLSDQADTLLWEKVKDVIRAQPAAGIAGASLGMAERPDSTPDLEGIDVPTLVITSTRDALIPPEATTPMAAQIPGAKLEIIEGAGHLSNLEAPEEFNGFLREHLVRCRALPG